MNIIELKKLIYQGQTLFGVMLCYLAFIVSHSDDAAQLLGSWIMVLIGSGLVGFGILTFAFKDDPDIWR